MKFLPKPNVGKEPDQIFIDLVKSYQIPKSPKTPEEVEKQQEKKRKKEGLLQCVDLVRIDSEAYKHNIPGKIAQMEIRRQFPQGITAADLMDVYTSKLVKSKKGREIYFAIMEQAEDGLCPICGVRDAATLDHYLPKSLMPTLAVTPNNLVPMCRDCNSLKLDGIETDPARAPIHVYFDEPITDPWLQAELSFRPGRDRNLTARYFVVCPSSWDAVLTSRVQAHLKLYELDELYKLQASREFRGRRRKWQSDLRRGPDALLRELTGTAESEQELDPNSWQAALYRALARQIDVLTLWLNTPGL